jgi:hypothetical protein
MRQKNCLSLGSDFRQWLRVVGDQGFQTADFVPARPNGASTLDASIRGEDG